MPTAPHIDTVELGSKAPRLDPTSSDAVNRLLFRLKDNNEALANLRRALDENGPVIRAESRETPFV